MGSSDQVRQCIEGIVQRDHDHQNVVVIVRETLKAEYVIALTDVEGKFLQSDLVYRDTPLRRKHTEEDAQIIEDIRQQLEEANQVITSATAKDEELARIISDLQDALCERDEVFSPSIPDLQQVYQTADGDKGRLPQSSSSLEKTHQFYWMTGCPA